MGFKTSFEYFTELLQNISTDATDSHPCIINQLLDTLQVSEPKYYTLSHSINIKEVNINL